MCLFQNEFKIIPWNKSNLFIFVHKICFAFFFLFEVVKQKFNRPNIRIKKLEWICMGFCVNVSFVIVEKNRSYRQKYFNKDNWCIEK